MVLDASVTLDDNSVITVGPVILMNERQMSRNTRFLICTRTNIVEALIYSDESNKTRCPSHVSPQNQSKQKYILIR